MKQIKIDDEILYIEGLQYLGDERYTDDSIRDYINIDTLRSALKPVVKVGKILKQGIQELSPQEVEFTLQLQLGVSGEKLAFAIVNTEAQAHLSVKFSWKRDAS